jgi:hypothetical protein
MRSRACRSLAGRDAGFGGLPGLTVGVYETVRVGFGCHSGFPRSGERLFSDRRPGRRKPSLPLGNPWGHGRRTEADHLRPAASSLRLLADPMSDREPAVPY